MVRKKQSGDHKVTQVHTFSLQHHHHFPFSLFLSDGTLTCELHKLHGNNRHSSVCRCFRKKVPSYYSDMFLKTSKIACGIYEILSFIERECQLSVISQLLIRSFRTVSLLLETYTFHQKKAECMNFEHEAQKRVLDGAFRKKYPTITVTFHFFFKAIDIL